MCSFHAAIGLLVHNVESTVDAHPHKVGTFGDCDLFLIPTGQYPAKVFFFRERERERVRKCLSALRQYRTLNCSFVGGHPIFFRIDRAENADPWPSFSTQLNSGASSHFTALVALPCLTPPAFPVCLHTHLSRHLHPLWDSQCGHCGGCQQSDADFLWHCSF